jgi:surface carbohydrate biosynthesis protein (TIGR04326 family)
VFSGFWDWSVWWDGAAQSLADRYFKCLPDEVIRQGVSSIGWFAWLDPHSKRGEEKRRLKEVLAPLSGRKDGVILQSFLRPWDILKAVGDFRPLARFLKVRKRSAFREVFQNDGIDYYPLFSQVLLRGFLDASLLHGDLVALATERACRRHRPKVALSFLEHFPHSRAHYEGVRRAGVGTVCLAVQHASYSHEKTFLFLHPSLEFRGETDGFVVPHPDYVCAMGTLGQELFLECGYPRERVFLTGSPRYDHVTDRCNAKHTPSARRNEKLYLLMVSTLHLELELEMIEAVCAALRDVKKFKLLFRNHPFRRIQQHPRFAEFKDQIQVTQGLLEEDLDRADLVLFTYSTVAEEAFVRGKPVWQWLPLGFNGSALAEAVRIPQFESIARLRQALQDFQAEPSRFLPIIEARKLVVKRLFFLGDGRGAARIAGVVGGLLAEGAGHSVHCSLPGAGSLVPIL